MSFTTILGKKDFLEYLRGKRATFVLALSNTKTYEIPGITQAGIPNKIYLTPTLDSEFLCSGEIRSLDDIAKTPKGVPTPALMTRAVHLLHPFSNIELFNLGLEVDPKVEYFQQHFFDMKPSESINKGANIDAMAIFQQGLAFGQSYETKDDYIILAECVPAGTTTSQAVAKALGYNVDGLFASSFKDAPTDIKSKTIEEALSHITDDMDIFAKLGCVADNMLIFNAGFLLGLASKQTKVLLAGGTQISAVLLIVNSMMKVMQGEYDSSTIGICTTKWVNDDQQSDFKAILEQLDFKVNAYASDFDFSTSSHPALKLYDEGEAKEGVGAGAALVYAMLNGIKKEDIINTVEEFLG